MTEAPEPLQVWVDIRKNATGEVRRVKEPKLWRGDADTPDFWWTDGNAGCDCNRELFFLRVKDEPEDDDDDDDDDGVECGHTKFSIRATTLDGMVIYDEFVKRQYA